DVLPGVGAGAVDTSSLSGAARELADTGVPVFPCVPGGKRPLTGHGFHDATTDPGQVAAWWRQHPQANIGVPTGVDSGVVGVDVDVRGYIAGITASRRSQDAWPVAGWQHTVT